MASADRLETERLVMRRWTTADQAPFARLNADPEVMRYFEGTMTSAMTAGFVQHIEAQFERVGYGLWALEVRDTGRFIGFTGLAQQTFEASFTPAVEIGWRLAVPAWGMGYASEAAEAALAFGFERAALAEIVSMTTVTNEPSQAVMRRIGMTYDPADDFEHPRVPEGHRYRPHVLYRLTRDQWRARHTADPAVPLTPPHR